MGSVREGSKDPSLVLLGEPENLFSSEELVGDETLPWLLKIRTLRKSPKTERTKSEWD